MKKWKLRLNLSNALKVIIIGLLIWLCLEYRETRHNEWCSSEIQILRDQLSSIYFYHGLNDE